MLRVVGWQAFALAALLVFTAPPAGIGSGAIQTDDASLFALPFRQADSALELSAAGRLRAQVFSRYYQGLTLERAGKIDAALDAYEKAFREAPQQQRLAYRASDLAGQFREIERGMQILEENYRRNPGEPEVYIRLSEYLSTYHENRKERLDRALQVLRDAHEKFPQEPRVCGELVEALLLRQEGVQAQQVLEKAMNQQTSRPEYWLQLARIAPRLHRLEKGTGNPVVNSLYEKALQFSNHDVRIGTQVGDYFRLTEQFERAKTVFQQIIAAHPEELEAREKLAGIYSLMNEDDMVLATLLELERINPHRLETQKVVAQLYLKRGEWNKSIEHFLKAFRISQGTVEEYVIVAHLLREVKRFQEAADLLKRARFHYPDELKLLVELGITNNALEDYGTAFQTFQETERMAEKLQPDLLNDIFYFAYGAAAERIKKFAEAEELFRKSIDMAPEDASPARAAAPYNYLGYMWLEQDKNLEEAGKLILRANELNPGQSAYLDSLGWYYYKAGDFKNSLKNLLASERALAEEGDREADNSVIFDHIAQAYFKLGHKQQALDYLQKAVDMAPANEEFRKRLKEYQQAQGLAPVPLDFLSEKTSAAPREEEPAGKPVPPAPAKPGDGQPVPN